MRGGLDRLRAPFTGVVNLFSILFAIYGTMAAIYVGSTSSNNKADAANIVLVVLVFALVLWIGFREFSLARKQKYANASHSIYHMSSKFRSLNEYLLDCLDRVDSGQDVSVREVQRAFVDSIQGICDEVVHMFGILTGTQCRATIKCPAFDAKGSAAAWVETVARDTNSADSNRQMDQMRAEHKTDLIEDNEDFFMLFDDATPDIGYYCCNDLPGRFYAGELESTSISVYRQVASASGRKLKDSQYPLPYRSALVWPVRTGDARNSPRFYAFLAVDSESRHVFYEAWDTKLGGAIAEQANTSFRLFHQLLHTLSVPKS